MADLTGKQRSHLRGLGHHLSPVVLIGQDGLTGSLIQQVQAQLTAHELIKIKVGEGSPTSAGELADALAQATTSHKVQVIGHVVLLYKPHPEKPVIRV